MNTFSLFLLLSAIIIAPITESAAASQPIEQQTKFAINSLEQAKILLQQAVPMIPHQDQGTLQSIIQQLQTLTTSLSTPITPPQQPLPSLNSPTPVPTTPSKEQDIKAAASSAPSNDPSFLDTLSDKEKQDLNSYNGSEYIKNGEMDYRGRIPDWYIQNLWKEAQRYKGKLNDLDLRSYLCEPVRLAFQEIIQDNPNASSLRIQFESRPGLTQQEYQEITKNFLAWLLQKLPQMNSLKGLNILIIHQDETPDIKALKGKIQEYLSSKGIQASIN